MIRVYKRSIIYYVEFVKDVEAVINSQACYMFPVLVRKCFIKHMCFIVLYFHGHAFFCWKLSKSALLCFILGKMCFIFGFLFKNIKVGEL